ncbi:MAG: pilus assembly protein PilP [Nitrospirae bacterium]|nr:pilus assembly protein PilP [Nitrospirota bacterium]
MTADSGKALAAAKSKKDKTATDNAQKDADMAVRLAQLVAVKYPATQAAVSGDKAYSSMGKRDPFMSPLEVPKLYPKIPATASPLERVSTEQLQVKAIMWSSKGYRALVITPEKLGFTVKVGDTLGNKKGKITKITEKRIYVVEKITDILGDVETRNIVLKLHKEAQ